MSSAQTRESKHRRLAAFCAAAAVLVAAGAIQLSAESRPTSGALQAALEPEVLTRAEVASKASENAALMAAHYRERKRRHARAQDYEAPVAPADPDGDALIQDALDSAEQSR